MQKSITPCRSGLILVIIALALPLSLLAAPDMKEVAANAEQLASDAVSELTPGQVIVWLVTGALVGTVMGMLAARRAAGLGAVGNLFLGLLGAFLGGLLFRELDINLGLGEFVLSYDDLVSAFVGASVLVVVLLLVKARVGGAGKPPKRS